MLILYVPMFASWGVAGFLDARLNWRASGPARSTPETQPGEALVSASAQGFDRSLLTGWNFGSTTEPHAAHPLPRRILLEASTSRAVATAEHPLIGMNEDLDCPDALGVHPCSVSIAPRFTSSARHRLASVPDTEAMVVARGYCRHWGCFVRRGLEAAYP